MFLGAGSFRVAHPSGVPCKSLAHPTRVDPHMAPRWGAARARPLTMNIAPLTGCFQLLADC